MVNTVSHQGRANLNHGDSTSPGQKTVVRNRATAREDAGRLGEVPYVLLVVIETLMKSVWSWLQVG